MPRVLPSDVHRQLDQAILPVFHALDIEQLDSAAMLLHVILLGCQVAYSTTWPVNIAAATQALLETRPDIHNLLKNCQRQRGYAEIRELDEFHFHKLRVETQGDQSDEEILQKAMTLAENHMENYFSNKPQIPTFQAPPDVSDELRKHINALELPLSLDGNGLPSLLVHNLQHRSSSAHSQRLEKLFEVCDATKFICNTSGSGKTRMLLEGLTTRWGFYFTCRADEIGSVDLSEVLLALSNSEIIRDLPPTDHDHTLQQNVHHARRRFAQLLLARLMVMTCFLRRLSAEGDITHKHKEQWLLLQLAPKTLLGEDVFTAVTNRLENLQMNYNELGRKIQFFSFAIENALGLTFNKMICVLDEAQHSSNMLTKKFMSIDGYSERPVLREQLMSWSRFLDHILVSGTGLSMTKIERLFNSSAVKDLKLSYEVFTETGAFDTLAQQKRYLDQYCPSGYFDNEEGEVLLSRIGYWLHGRHRFTASYVARLIASGFKAPHRTLNDYVRDITKYEPLDATSLTEKEPPVKRQPATCLHFNSRELGQDDGLRRSIAKVLFEYIATGVPRHIHVTEHTKLVEFGVARFIKERNAVVDEPLALLSISNYFSENTCWTSEYFRQELVDSSRAATRGFGMESVVAYILGFQFSSLRPLSDVFKFVGDDRPLFHCQARLVAVQRVNGQLKVYPVDLSNPLKGATYRHGHSPRTVLDFAHWLRDPNRIPFCFPPNAVGPDTFFALLLDNGQLLWVAEQSKLRASGTGPAFCTEALAKTIPENFMTENREVRVDLVEGKRKKVLERTRVITNPDEHELVLRNLDQLDDRTDMAGVHSVLRVLVCFPSKPEIVAEDVADLGNHPVASVDFDKLVTSDAMKQILDSLSRNALMDHIFDTIESDDDDDNISPRKRSRIS